MIKLKPKFNIKTENELDFPDLDSVDIQLKPKSVEEDVIHITEHKPLKPKNKPLF